MAEQVLAPPRLSTKTELHWRERFDGEWYGLRLCYNTRMQWWTLDLEASDGSPLWSGVRIVTGVNLNVPVVDGAPPGQIFALDVESQNRDPGRHDLAGPIVIYYRPLADVLAAVGTAIEVL
jgi:hypothetical protein